MSTSILDSCFVNSAAVLPVSTDDVHHNIRTTISIHAYNLRSIPHALGIQALKMSETDPLLPKGASAPEISGYGFSRPSKVQYQTQSKVLDRDENVEDEDNSPTSTGFEGFSPLRTLIVLFTIVVGLAMLITLLVPGTIDGPNDKPKDDTLTVRARVEKILSENPLIGV